MNPFALTLLIAFSALGAVIITIIVWVIRTVFAVDDFAHDLSDDDAELDDLHVASVARRGRGFASFHEQEL